MPISQEGINLFATATQDFQWIHVDSQRALADSPTHGTIAHGYFILSLIPRLLNDILKVENLDRVVNVGINKLAYKNAVPVGGRIRLAVDLQSAKDLGIGCQATFACRMEIEGAGKIAFEGNIVFVYYFKGE